MDSYDEIYKRMCDNYEKRVGGRPDRSSDIGVRMAVLAGEIFSAQTELNWLKTQMFPQTATGEYLDLHAAQRGLSRKEGTKASGDVIFYLWRYLTYELVIPKGTVCATRGENPVRFVTTEDVTIMAARMASNVHVEAVEVGESGNVNDQEINVLVTPIAEIRAVLNDVKMEGGSDVESDEELRQRVLDSYVNIPNGTNKAFYIQSAKEVDGVRTVGVIPRNRGIGTVDVFIMSYDGSPSDELIEQVQNHLDSLREINVDIKVGRLNLSGINIYVNIGLKEGYEFDTVKASCEAAINEYFSLLDAGETVYLSAIGEYIAKVEGVKNYTFVRNLCDDVTVTADSVAVPNTILVMERESE